MITMLISIKIRDLRVFIKVGALRNRIVGALRNRIVGVSACACGEQCIQKQGTTIVKFMLATCRMT